MARDVWLVSYVLTRHEISTIWDRRTIRFEEGKVTRALDFSAVAAGACTIIRVYGNEVDEGSLSQSKTVLHPDARLMSFHHHQYHHHHHHHHHNHHHHHPHVHAKPVHHTYDNEICSKASK